MREPADAPFCVRHALRRSSLLENPHGRRRHDGDRDEHREGDGGADRDGDVAEQLPRFFADEQHGNEHGQVGERRVQQRAQTSPAPLTAASSALSPC